MKHHQRKNSRTAAAICNLTGALLLIGVILVCLPLTLPRVFGYEVYTVISGSMEPAIPTGSLVYIEETDPAEIEENDIIAFYSQSDSGAIITHRVVKNQVVSGQFITKGDANEAEDLEPVSYELFLGKMVCHIAGAGRILSFVVTLQGKIAAIVLVILAVILHTIAGRLRDARASV